MRNSLVRKIGCKLPWDKLTSWDFTVCSSVDNLRSYAVFYNKIYVADLTTIFNWTGCSKPCHYKEYSLLGEDKFVVNGNRIVIYADENVLIKKELISYSGLSLQAEFGVSLGMFLGFSFLMVWDLIEFVVMKFIQAWTRNTESLGNF